MTGFEDDSTLMSGSLVTGHRNLRNAELMAADGSSGPLALDEEEHVHGRLPAGL